MVFPDYDPILTDLLETLPTKIVSAFEIFHFAQYNKQLWEFGKGEGKRALHSFFKFRTLEAPQHHRHQVAQIVANSITNDAHGKSRHNYFAVAQSTSYHRHKGRAAYQCRGGNNYSVGVDVQQTRQKDVQSQRTKNHQRNVNKQCWRFAAKRGYIHQRGHHHTEY